MTEKQTDDSQSAHAQTAIRDLIDDEDEPCFLSRWFFQSGLWNFFTGTATTTTTTASSSSPSSSSKPDEGHDEAAEPKPADTSAFAKPPAQMPYVPQHAKASFLKTATPRQMKRANETL
ncbi:hypothetical protein GGR54DRAFT_530558 [Hypoxylon sp. NC1633]|nr:hypothetical protein GGR54DRAFT_530558 [Hypoxylon sp. NC1633]